MSIEIFLPVLLSALVVMIGWPIVHSYNLRRDIEANRRELRVKYLLETYRQLEINANRNEAESLPIVQRAFEAAVSDIQLLGSSEQIEALLEYLEKFQNNTSMGIEPVLNLLREELRDELGLEKVSKLIHQFRFNK